MPQFARCSQRKIALVAIFQRATAVGGRSDGAPISTFPRASAIRRLVPQTPDPKRIVRRFYAEAINGRDLDAIDRLLAPGFRHNGEERGRSGQRRAVEAFLDGFSDLHHEILIILAEGDLVSAHQRWTGTHDGPFMGSSPSGRKVAFTSIAILRVHGGEIAEAWDVTDIALAAQL